MTATASVAISHVRIQYESAVAVDDVSLHIRSGEFFTLLGASGCGKTTLLRAIAGFNRQSAGTIKIGDVVVDDLPAHQRDTGMVFQNYAIFPHLTVRENVAYGLVSRDLPKADIDKRVGEALAMVDLAGFDARMPRQLSGGQQQRVVIARAIVIRPRVLLMDEPLANLDAKLRVRLRQDLRVLQQRLGITTIYVTHDQEEALSISDRVAVMKKGRVLQIGTPEDIYATPADISVARFVGEGSFLKATLMRGDADAQVRLADGTVRAIAPTDLPPGAHWIGMRPEHFKLANDVKTATFVGRLAQKSYFGPFFHLVVELPAGDRLIARIEVDDTSRRVAPGDAVGLNIEPRHIRAFAGDEGEPFDE